MKNISFRLLSFAALIFLAAMCWRGCISKYRDNVILQERVVQRDDSVQYYRDYAGREHAIRLQLQADIGTIRAIYRDHVDSFTRILGIKEKQLQSFAVIGTAATGSVKAPLDSVPGNPSTRTFKFSDGYLSAFGTVSDSVSMNYLYRDSLFYANYWKRSWFLGRKRYYQDVFSLNKNCRITGLDGAQLAIREPGRFGIGPELAYGWDGKAWRLYVGIGIHYSLVRF